MPRNPRRSVHGFTLIEVLVVMAIIGVLVALLVVLVRGSQRLAKERKCIAQMTGLESAVHVYVTRFSALPPLAEAVVPPPGPAFGAAGANYVNSAYLHYWLGSRLSTVVSYGAGPGSRKLAEPLLRFEKSEVSTWRALPEALYGADRFDASGKITSPGFVLDPWGNALAYVPLGAAEGDHGTASFPRSGNAFALPGRNLTGFVELWSRGEDGNTPLPAAGPAPGGAAGDADDLVLWFLPYY